jgi:pimeloyl-ACP methyl ester carboxylesterase
VPPFDWWDSGRDILDVVEASLPAGDADTIAVVGVGHSSGGAALVLAELLRPGTFGALVLVEPIILPPPYGRYPDHPIVTGALRRRTRFTSRDAAFRNYASKRAFSGWDERAMWAYVNGGFRVEGDRVVLKCAPESEAEFFTAAGTHGAWDRLGDVETPTLLLAGEHSVTHGEPFLAELTARFGDGRYEIVPDSSHFLWMEKPGVIAEHVAAAIHEMG